MSITEPTEPTKPGATSDATALASAQDQVAEIFGDIAEFWGFTRTQGRVFGLLFMSPEPLDHRTVRERLGISAGSASMTLTSLVEWRVLHRDGRLYVAETDFYKLITMVLRQREGDRIRDCIARAEQVVQLVRRVPPGPRRSFVEARIRHIVDFFDMGNALFEAVIERSPVRGLLNTISRRSARLRPLPFPRRGGDVRLGA